MARSRARSLPAGVAIAAIAWFAGSCKPRTPAVTLTVADSVASIQCRPRTEGTSALGNEWATLAPYIESCRALTANGQVVLEIVTVSAGRYYGALPANSETTTLPKPVIFTADHREAGRLPYSYPDDPPVAIELSFSDWRDGRPHQIDILVRDPTVSGDHRLSPMRWDPALGRYRGGAER